MIVAREEEARKAVRNIAYAERPGGIARRLQPYTLCKFTPRFREQLVKNNQVYFEAHERFGAQFAILFELRASIKRMSVSFGKMRICSVMR